MKPPDKLIKTAKDYKYANLEVKYKGVRSETYL